MPLPEHARKHIDRLTDKPKTNAAGTTGWAEAKTSVRIK